MRTHALTCTHANGPVVALLCLASLLGSAGVWSRVAAMRPVDRVVVLSCGSCAVVLAWQCHENSDHRTCTENSAVAWPSPMTGHGQPQWIVLEITDPTTSTETLYCIGQCAWCDERERGHPRRCWSHTLCQWLIVNYPVPTVHMCVRKELT
eukprot:Opistho-2@55939